MRSAQRIFWSSVGVGDTGNFGIDPIPSKYRVVSSDTDTIPILFAWKCHDH